MADDDEDCDKVEKHKGSFSLAAIQESPHWQNRVLPVEFCPKRKYAVAVGYCGSKYQGLQINPGAITIGILIEM